MKKIFLLTILALAINFANAQTTADQQNLQKAGEWVGSLNLADAAKEAN